MTTAVKALAKQQGFSDPSLQPELAAESVDLDNFLVDVVNDHAPGFDIRAAITDGYIERTIDGASTLSVTVHDSDMTLIKSGIFGDGTEERFPAMDVNIDGLWFRLAQVSKSGSDIVLTFEDRWVAWLRLKKKPRKASRNDVTRAHFARTLVREIKRDGGMEFFSPDIDKKRPIAKAKDPAERKKNRDPGLPRLAGGGSLPSGFDFKIKNKRATQTQMDYIEKALDTGLSMDANRKCMVSAVMTMIQESTVTTQATNGSHVGLYQQDSSPGSVWVKMGGASRDPIKDSKAYFTVCIKNEKASPHISHADLAESVQASGQGSLYNQWQSEAIAFVDAYDNHGGFIKGGASSVDDTTSATDSSNTYGKQYEFHRGPPDGDANENTWTCTERLASEVNWRRFIVGNRFYFLSDFMLMKASPSMIITEDTDGVDWIDFDMDSGKPVAEAVVKCRASLWFAPPGTIVAVDELGPATGRWICYTVHRNLFSSDCEITLRQAEHSKKEPATEIVTRASDSSSSDAPSVGGYFHPMGAGLKLGRVDMGVDFTGKGSIYAIGNAKVTRVAQQGSGTGWPGAGDGGKGNNGAIIVYQLLDGSKSGKYVYLAENIDPIAGLKVGDKLDAGQEYARARGEMPFLEIGWAANGQGRTEAAATTGYSEGQQTVAGKDFKKLLDNLSRL